jgi:hypothetical protein
MRTSSADAGRDRRLRLHPEELAERLHNLLHTVRRWRLPCGIFQQFRRVPTRCEEVSAERTETSRFLAEIRAGRRCEEPPPSKVKKPEHASADFTYTYRLR